MVVIAEPSSLAARVPVRPREAAHQEILMRTMAAVIERHHGEIVSRWSEGVRPGVRRSPGDAAGRGADGVAS